MIRLTVAEAALFLGQNIMWIYNTSRKVGIKSIKTFLGEEEIYLLMRYGFLARSYEGYDFKEFEDSKMVRKLDGVDKLRELTEDIKTVDDFCALVIAWKIKHEKTSIFNIIAYINRKLGLNYTGKDFKKYIYGKILKKFLDGKVSISVFLGENGNKIGKDIRIELENSIKSTAKEKC